MKKKTRIMVFGVFDRLHPGHRAFLTAARTHGDELMVVVARDVVVSLLKHKTPHQPETERLQAIGRVSSVDAALLGDQDIGSYQVIHTHQPDIICLGYDQDGLHNDLQRRIAEGELDAIPIIRVRAHEPERFHTSLLDGSKRK